MRKRLLAPPDAAMLTPAAIPKPLIQIVALTSPKSSRYIEVMYALKKRQGSLFRHLLGAAGEVSLVHRAFGLT